MSRGDTELDWRTQDLRRSLRVLLPGIEVQALASVDSTNTRLLEQLRSIAPPTLLVAEEQTRGRGRNGRAWQSAPGASLTFSLALPLAPPDWSGLSLAVGVALADAIEARPARLQLKWPNDLWLRDAPGRWRKLGGILIETMSIAGGRACVAGVGLNVRPQPELQGLASGHACLQEIEPGLDAPELLQRVAPALLQALLRFEREGFAAFADGYGRRDLLRGRAVSTSLAALPEGVAEGVDGQGALRVRGPQGVVAVGSGEVSVRPAAEA